jgi:hypothetical protein
MSFLMSSSHLFFVLSSGLLNIGFHLYTFFLSFFLLAFYVNGQTNLIFVLLCNLLCSYVLLVYLIHRLILSQLSHIYLNIILILYFHLRIGRPSGLFYSGFTTIILHAFLFITMRATLPAHLILLRSQN